MRPIVPNRHGPLSNRFPQAPEISYGRDGQYNFGVAVSEVASQSQLWMAFARRALVTVPLTVLLGFASGALSNSGNGNRWYAALDKPSFQPPALVFPVAWTLLYAMLGVALAIVLSARGARLRGYAVALFVVAFVLNLAWSPLFFGLHRTVAALALLGGMSAAAIATTIAFWQVRRAAGWLMLPYLAWLVFAGMLNWEIVRLNPDADGLVLDRSGTQIDIRR